MALHAVGAADDEHGVVKHLQGAFGLGGKIDVSGRVEQIEDGVAVVEHSLLGKNGDAALALQRVGVQKGVLVVNAAELADVARAVHHGFAQGGFARVHMRQYADGYSFHALTSVCFFA